MVIVYFLNIQNALACNETCKACQALSTFILHERHYRSALNIDHTVWADRGRRTVPFRFHHLGYCVLLQGWWWWCTHRIRMNSDVSSFITVCNLQVYKDFTKTGIARFVQQDPARILATVASMLRFARQLCFCVILYKIIITWIISNNNNTLL